MSTSYINYFGYGVMASPTLIKTLLGRIPKYKKATLHDFGIFIENWKDIPEDVKDILANYWSSRDKFRSYSIKRKKGKVVAGKVWQVTPEERRVIDEWDVTHRLWYHPFMVEVQLKNGGNCFAETEAIFTSDSEIEYISDSRSYPFFLNDREKMFYVAAKLNNFFSRNI